MVRLPHHNLGVRALWTGTNVREGWFELAPTDETSIIAGRAGRANGVTGTGGRQARKVSAAEKQQARDVSLRRIGAAVRALPLASSPSSSRSSSPRPMVGAGLAVPAPRRHRRRAARTRTCRCWSGWSVGMVAVAVVTSALGVVQTWISHHGRPAGHARAAHRRLRPPAAPVDRLLHPHPHRRGAVAASPTTSAACSRSSPRPRPRSPPTSPPPSPPRSRWSRCRWRLSLISLVVLPPAIWLTRRVARMRREITAAAAARARRPQRHHRGGAVDQRRAARQDAGHRARAGRSGSPRPSARLIDLELRSQLAGRWRMASMSIIFAAIPARDLPRRRAARRPPAG